MTKPRKYTEDEIIEKFIGHIWVTIDYWMKTDLNGSEFKEIVENEGGEQRYRMSGLVHSILVMLDGGSANLPGFIVAPYPHSTDKEYNKNEGNNWYPENHKIKNQIDGEIGGSLHELLYEIGRKLGYVK